MDKGNKQHLLKLYNGRVITSSGILKEGSVIIRGGMIEKITTSPIELPSDATTIDCQGNYIAPGAIDIHCHGGGGCDFTEATAEAFLTVARIHAEHGMTSIYPTIACAPNETFYKVFDAMAEVATRDDHGGANILGLHLEGNYLNPAYKGGQYPEFLLQPNRDEYRQMLDYSPYIKRWSISPELQGAMAMAREISNKGVVASIAHTEADHATMLEAVESGFSMVTHLYNAMSGVHKRGAFKHSGVIESCYLIDELNVEIIADGVHNPPTLLRFAHKFKGVEKTAIVTDSNACAALEGVTSFYGGRVIIEDGVGKTADRTALSSSIATSDRLIRVMVQQAGIPLLDAVRMASETPARIMNIGDKKGSLQKGLDADIIVFNDAIDVLHTMIGGRVVFSKEA